MAVALVFCVGSSFLLHLGTRLWIVVHKAPLVAHQGQAAR